MGYEKANPVMPTAQFEFDGVDVTSQLMKQAAAAKREKYVQAAEAKAMADFWMSEMEKRMLMSQGDEVVPVQDRAEGVMPFPSQLPDRGHWVGPRSGEAPLMEPTFLTNEGHGHVHPRPDGIKARCGGPSFCRQCAKEYAELHKNDPLPLDPPESTVQKPLYRRSAFALNADSLHDIVHNHPMLRRQSDILAAAIEVLIELDR